MAVEPAPSSPPGSGRVPDFFIVGHAKCGTTALYEMLRAQPSIFMPAIKEPMFFARDPEAPVEEEALRAEGERRFAVTGRWRESFEDYLARFAQAGPEQIVGEGSTFYLFSERAPARIARAQPQARIIALLREPAAFLHSLHLQMLQNGAEDEPDLRRAIALEDERRRGLHIPPRSFWPEALMYTQRVRYAEQLRRYHEAFGRGQVLVLVYEEFRADNAGTLARVLEFLGAPDAPALGPVRANPSVAVRAGGVDRAVRRLRTGAGPGARAGRAVLKTLAPRGVRHGLLHPLRRRLVYAPPPVAEEQLMQELRERFRGEVDAASEYLGRDLARLWGYRDA